MAHSSTQIYSNSTYGVEIADLQSVLNTDSEYLGDIITDPNVEINKWAKYKPYRSSSLATTENGRMQAFYGLSVQEFEDLGSPTTTGTFLYKLVNGQLNWEYLRPRGKGNGDGGSDEWFRLLDFDGYDHSAECPVGDYVETSVIDSSGNATIAWDLVTVGSGNITLSDIYIGSTPIVGNYYFGVLLVRGTTYKIATSSSTVSSGDVQIYLSNATQLEGSWRAYPFFSSVQIALDGNTGTGSYLSAGFTGYIDIEFRAASSYFAVNTSNLWNAAHTEVTVDWEAINETSAAKSLSATFALVKSSSSSSSAGGSTEDNETITISVASGSSLSPTRAYGTITLTNSHPEDYPNYTWWVTAKPDGYAMTEMQIEEPEEEEEGA